MRATTAEAVEAPARAQASPVRMGITFFLMSESFLFGSLFWTYYYLRALTPGWPPHHPAMSLAAINTAFLFAGSCAVWAGVRSIRNGKERGLRTALLIAALLGAAFLGITLWEWFHEDFTPSTDAYGSIFFTLTGFHALHVLGGVLLMLALLGRTMRHRFSAGDFAAVEAGSMYWHFVDVIWILVFATIFIAR
jgi:heme/copper-type cytochrome/quinol oxidase subunit 3